MATSEFWQRVIASVSSSPEWVEGVASGPTRNSQVKAKLWMTLDGLTILVAAMLAILFKMHTGPLAAVKGLWEGTLMHGRPLEILLAILVGYGITLFIISWQLKLYAPTRLSNISHEQWLSIQACFTSGLLLMGTLYLVDAGDFPRTVVLIMVALVTVLLSLRRLIYRILMYRRFERGIGTRNVLIVGTGLEALALRHHLESIPHLGYTFKGFIDFPGVGTRHAATAEDVVGGFGTLFQHAREKFVDEIFFTTPCERGIIQEVLAKSRVEGVDLRVVPEMYDGLTWNSPIEYIGQFPTIPLHRGQAPEAGLLFKRILDIAMSSLALLIFTPVMLAVAIAIKLDSRGPVFYTAERIGKKGRVFRCIKFRTMVRDAEKRRVDVAHLNERDGVLFKISNDPRITKLGRFLRKYSLDELPQFFNALRGDMSVVGPRPPLASEVKKYELCHLRRLDVTPGITGLWQVQARQDPSFDNYISLDVAYIENWSLLLDLKIIIRTIGVVVSGTGT